MEEMERFAEEVIPLVNSSLALAGGHNSYYVRQPRHSDSALTKPLPRFQPRQKGCETCLRQGRVLADPQRVRCIQKGRPLRGDRT